MTFPNMFVRWKEDGRACVDRAVARILWAEASDHDRMFIQAILGQLPSPPFTEFVADGADLLERIDETKPDVVVLDLQLPDVGGLEVLSRLKGRPSRPRVVVFSRLASHSTISACHGLGASEYVVKPAGFRRFRGLVEGIAASASGTTILQGSPERLAAV